MFHDWYLHVKQPPFKDVNAMAWGEGNGLNIGFMYFQDASPSGPTAWAMSDSVVRNVRWLTSPTAKIKMNFSGTHEACAQNCTPNKLHKRAVIFYQRKGWRQVVARMEISRGKLL